MSIKISKVIRSRRKTVALEVREDASLIVRAPYFTSGASIRRLVDRKRRWISQKQELVRSRNRKKPKREFVDGEGFWYLGRPYNLQIVERQDHPLVLKSSFLLSKRSAHRAKDVFIRWYKEQAERKISERAVLYASRAGLRYKKINITSAQKRWGSCGANGSINFSWRLIMAPLEVIDYVVVHELAHLKEKGHPKRFWQAVSTLLPGYERQKEWLKENGHGLSI